MDPRAVPQIDAKDLRDLLKEEYFKLQDLFEDFDNRALTIKGWVASGAIAALALAFGVSEKFAPFAFYIPIFVATVTACVWGLETTWKIFQGGFAGRIRTIEAYFRDDPDRIDKTPKPLQIYHAWADAFHRDPPIYEYERAHRPRNIVLRFLGEGLHPSVSVPYLPILVLCAFTCHLLVR
jgi:hypothetical protein